MPQHQYLILLVYHYFPMYYNDDNEYCKSIVYYIHNFISRPNVLQANLMGLYRHIDLFGINRRLIPFSDWIIMNSISFEYLS
jgi:hypothetical protein